jgi:hypothetical protein
MANLIPLAYADLELQLSGAITAADTTFTLTSATDDDGNSLPAGKYCFTIDNGSTNKEYLMGQLNGTTVTSVVSVSRQGVESSGAARAHRVGATAIVTDFATIQRVADALRGQIALDGDNPIVYDAEPTLTDRKEFATVAYVLDNVAGGTVSFDSQIVTGVNAGETVADGDLVYFKTADQEWYLADALVAAEVNGVQMGIALGAGTDGAAITGGVQISGSYTTTGLTAGSAYYATDTAGTIGTSAGTTERIIGVALSTTELLLSPKHLDAPTSDEKDALVGDLGTPSASNTFLTEGNKAQVVTFTASGTWTKDTGLQRIKVQTWGAGGSGGKGQTNNAGGGGGGGAYVENWLEASELAATETVTIGAGGASATTNANGTAGGTTTFGSLVTVYGGGAGAGSNGEVAGGGGGGVLGVGGDAASTAPGDGGSPSAASGSTGAVGEDSDGWGGGAGGGANAAGGGKVGGASASGGGGGGGAGSTGGGAGGSSIYGGAGGGGGGNTGAGANGGSSLFGGDGGPGAFDASNATAGTQPGGGGGGSETGDSGAGGDGQVIVTEYYT